MGQTYFKDIKSLNLNVIIYFVVTVVVTDVTGDNGSGVTTGVTSDGGSGVTTGKSHD